MPNFDFDIDQSNDREIDLVYAYSITHTWRAFSCNPTGMGDACW